MRKEIDVTIDADNRDKGKTFHIREMAATKAEKWAMRALLAVARSGVEIPANLQDGGMQAIAVLGIQAIMKMHFEDAEPLLDEMMECISFKPDPQKPNVVRPLWEDDIEEVVTRIRLRKEVLDLHVGFSIGAGISKSTSETREPSPSSNTRTSRRR